MNQNNENNFTTEIPEENNFTTAVPEETPATENTATAVQDTPFCDTTSQQTDYNANNNTYNYTANNGGVSQNAGYATGEIPVSSYNTAPQQTAGYTSGQIPTSGYSYDANVYKPVSNVAYDYNQYTYEQQQDKQTNGPGLASLICGIVGFVLNPLYLVSLAAIITGIVGLAGSASKPKDTAVAGLILGIISLCAQIALDAILSVVTLGVCSCSILI